MKKAIYIIIFLLLIVVSYFITASVYPRYTIYFPVFGFILLLDLYLWFSHIQFKPRFFIYTYHIILASFLFFAYNVNYFCFLPFQVLGSGHIYIPDRYHPDHLSFKDLFSNLLFYCRYCSCSPSCCKIFKPEKT